MKKEYLMDAANVIRDDTGIEIKNDEVTSKARETLQFKLGDYSIFTRTNFKMFDLEILIRTIEHSCHRLFLKKKF